MKDVLARGIVVALALAALLVVYALPALARFHTGGV
jgi:hypothetical protein